MENDKLLEKVQAFKAWKEKFDAASPEEQERMRQERAEQRKKAEAERDKRIYDDRKQRFVSKTSEQIDALKKLIPAHQIALDIIKSFDGKILNNRLTNTIKERLKQQDKNFGADLEWKYNYDTKTNYGRLEISYYGIYPSVSVGLEITLNGDDRIVWASTQENKYNTDDGLRSLIAEREQAIKQYDKIYREAEKLSQTIEQYGKLNYLVRDWLKTEHVIRSTWVVG